MYQLLLNQDTDYIKWVQGFFLIEHMIWEQILVDFHCIASEVTSEGQVNTNNREQYIIL